MTEHNIDPNLAVDLSKPRAMDADVAAREAAKAQAKQEEARKSFAAWDRRMQRAFRGVVSRPLRHHYLGEYINRLEAQAEADKDD